MGKKSVMFCEVIHVLFAQLENRYAQRVLWNWLCGTAHCERADRAGMRCVPPGSAEPFSSIGFGVT